MTNIKTIQGLYVYLIYLESPPARECARAGSGSKEPLQVTLDIVVDHAQTRQVH